MAEVLRANILAHFAFYRRSRLLMAFALAFLLLTGLSSLPALFNDDGVKTFNALQQIFSILNVFLLFLAGGLGLFIVSSHLRNRSLKMVFTKPCSPALWLASAILSAAIVSLLLNAVVLSSAVVLSLIGKVPVRAGLVFVSADTFIASLGIIAYMVLLATLAHPAIAVTFALIFNAQMFYGAQMWTQAAIRAGSSSVALRVLEHIFHGLYLALPMIHAYGKQTEVINTSLRVLQGDWKYPLYSLGYVLVLTAFCYFVALFALQRKRHI
jgi:ABC-type transport system involved in multi-copper enzyme maturation permease subunit